jgi:hypothetical protein
VGADGSPNCGIHQTPMGYNGGVIGASEPVEEQIAGVHLATGTGVFMEELKHMLAEKSITTTFMAIDEKNPGEMRKKT